MKTLPRFQEDLPVSGLIAKFTTGWKAWFQDIYDALGGWNSTVSGNASLNFPGIPLGSESSLTAALPGAAVGDVVILSPMANVVGIIFFAVITAPSVVTVSAKNFSTDFVDAPSVNFKFIVFQK
jgi:hypothetical protein